MAVFRVLLFVGAMEAKIDPRSPKPQERLSIRQHSGIPRSG
jgi:hypothetical protein